MRGLTLSAAAIAALTTTASAAPVDREGRGQRRDALNAAEATPFDLTRLDALDAWINADAFDGGRLDGSVLVIATMDVARPGSLVIAPALQRLLDEHADDGLRVLAIHPDAGWDELVRHAESGAVTLPIARDRFGHVRTLLGADDDPDLFVIDRAGQMRYADITNASIAPAVEQLIAETAQHAAGEAQRRASVQGRIAAGLEQGRETAQASASEPAVTIPAERYEQADWPEHNPRLSAKDFQGRAMPMALGNEQWLTDRVETTGKVVVIDFWATWCGPCKRAAPKLDTIQRAHPDELRVLALSGSGEKVAKVKKYLVRNAHGYAYLHDERTRLANAFGVRGIPHTVVLSTDGVVRWQGNPNEPAFPEIVASVIEQDPGIQAQRRGERVSFAAAAPEPARQTRPIPIESLSPDADWPEHNTGKLYANSDVQGDRLDNPLAGLRWINGSQRPDTEGKVVVIDFWASWCGPCKRFSPRLDAAQQKYAGEVVAIGVAGQRESLEKVESYLATTDHSYADAFDAQQRLYKSIRVAAIPHVVILSSDGVVRWQGFPGNADFEGILDQVVKADRATRSDN